MPLTRELLGLLLVGHGTRSRRGLEEMLTLVRLLSERAAPTPVEPAFLELAEPTIAAGLARLTDRGARNVVVLPLLLFAAGHAKEDIPRAVAAAAPQLGLTSVTITQADHLGCHPAIVELSGWRFTESLQGRQPMPVGDTCLLLVGRGSHDPSATAEAHQFARLMQQRTGVAHTEVAFLAMAQPAVADVLLRLAASDWRRIVVEPHLLFQGELFDSLAAQVRWQQAQAHQPEWVITRYLAADCGCGGPADERLVAAVMSRLAEARIHVVAPRGGG